MSTSHDTAAPSFTTRNAAEPAFWNERFAAGFTPWQLAAMPQRLARWLTEAGCSLQGAAVLVPGAGAGPELAALAAAGLKVDAIDYAHAAVDAGRRRLAPEQAALLRQADFFDVTAVPGPYRFIYERTFACALPPERRTDWAWRVAGLVEPGGERLGYFYVMPQAPEHPRGPPFVYDRTLLDALLAPYFVLLEDEPSPDALDVFGGHERWMRWRRRPHAAPAP
ncbi:MAG TPA: hypothetical protein VFK82_00025 [Burkholderiaceae bacterium]|nr:hypothetical protein [Burkholderiaceae bacterium]